MEKFNFIFHVVLNGEKFHQHGDEVNSSAEILLYSLTPPTQSSTFACKSFNATDA